VLVSALALAAGLALAGCAPSDCDERAAWASRDTAACVMCERDCRSMAAESPVTGCDGELACVARCPDRSATTCGCSLGCLRTDRCRAAWEKVQRCYVSRCRDACR
jgi:hypothetical protein